MLSQSSDVAVGDEVDVIVAESTDLPALGKERHVQQNLQFITVIIASILKLALERH